MGETPSWTDIMQAFAAVIGVPLTIYTLYKLVAKDKERQAEIQNLTVIANQLTNMQIESEKRYKSSKKPNILIFIENIPERKSLKFIFKNTNLNSSLTGYNLANSAKIKNLDIARSGILNNEGSQTFYIDFNYNLQPIKNLKLDIDYSTEEGYIFIQDIIVWEQNGVYKMVPGPIIDKNNSALK
ncbi:hypothetical protein [Flavobacterium collinsii]|jgi:predicted ferric reductase|uniref:Uncharacterized protein n=1 Tax=Flavobacterium collinsii TaxID=1114861 RepID=A0A9W4X4M1_9FLAO|nr:hypothetical protein [Flavobacterium collinsii]CAI2768614.1 conserved protein of unknown function [Flavobacterium collinsii]